MYVIISQYLFVNANKKFPKDILFVLLQMIKLITFTTSGHAYLNFMGNEFGHPNVRHLIW